MAGLSTRGLRRPLALVICLVSAVALLVGSPATGEHTLLREASQAPRVPRWPLRVLQMNLCDSGYARCYTGRAVARAAALIQAEAPDVVTVNEVCAGDVEVLRRALAQVDGGGTVLSAFQSAGDRDTGAAFPCLDGDAYGIGLLVRAAATDRYRTYHGLYPDQEARDPEERVWVCVAVVDEFSACTTHLASGIPAVAQAQCRYLLGTALPGADLGPTVVGGDFNLLAGGTPDVRTCVPPGYPRADDGGVQQVLSPGGYDITSARVIPMAGVTDHPALLVTLSPVPSTG
jgi:endonuclease/exonuclease/phosphatase (EEP) superfamily protein YafD